MLLFYTRHVGGTEKKIILGFEVFLDILEYIIYIKNIPRKRAAGLPACCTLQSIYLISIFFFKCFKLFTNSPLVGGKRRETPRHKELAVLEA